MQLVKNAPDFVKTLASLRAEYLKIDEDEVKEGKTRNLLEERAMRNKK